MASFVLSLVLCVAGITVVVRIVAGMRKPPSRADRYLTDTILTLLLAVALQVRTVRADFDAWAGWNVTWPTQHALVMLSAWWALNYLVHATSTDSSRLRGFIRRHALVSGLTIVATIAAFAAEPTAPDFWYGPAGRIEGGGEVNAAGVVAFMVYGLYMTGSMALQAVHTVRWVRRAHVRWLGIGLGVIACGLVCGFAFGVDTAGFEAIGAVSGQLPALGWAIGKWLMPAGVGLCILGVLTASIGSRLNNPTRLGWWAYYRARRVLYPLWQRYVERTPALVLMPSARWWPDWARLNRAEFRLRRTLIEIWDAHRALRPVTARYGNIEARARTLGERAGLVDEELEAMVLAALDAVAFEEPQPVTAAGVTRRWDVPIDLARADLVQEVRWWRLVARHYRRSPIVRQILAEFRVGNFSPDMEPHRT